MMGVLKAQFTLKPTELKMRNHPTEEYELSELTNGEHLEMDQQTQLDRLNS